jgi:hypothetical protein
MLPMTIEQDLRSAGFEVAVEPTGALRVTRGDARILVHGETGPGSPALAILARICMETEADARTMLELAGDLGAGAIVRVAGRYAVRYTIPEGQLDGAPVAGMVGYAAELAVAVAGALAARRRAMPGALAAYVG